MASSILVAGLTGYYIFLLHTGWMNNGGSGVELPYNLIAWCVMSALSFVFWILQPSVSKSMFTPLYLSLFAGTLLMSLPLIWSPSLMAFYKALPRIGGLWAGMIFLLMLRSATFSERQKKILLHSLVFAGIAEALIILCELYIPGTWLPVIWQKLTLKYGRYGLGVFQQVNVTASFLATSLAICLMLFASGTFTNNNSNAERIRLTLLATAIILLTSVLTLLCSRIGWLSGCSSAGAAWFMLTFTRHKKRSRYHLLLLLLLLTGVVLGCQLMHTSLGQALAEHSGSNHQRILTLYHTVIFSGKHPLLGYGAGTYEGYYQSFMAGLQEGNLSRELMSHPHNELLYQYSEGGVIALTGVLLWYGMYLRLWLRAKSVIQVTALLAMLPLILHTQVEYPLYYSVPHWLTLLLLIRLSEGETETSVVTCAHYRAFRLVKAGFILLAAYGTVVSLQSYINGNIMNKFENNELASTQPITRMEVSWIQQFRYEQDINLARLIDFQSTHDIKSLRTFTDINADIIAVHPDPSFFSNQIAVLNYLHEYQQANKWLLRAHYTLPWETQFSVN